MILVSHVLRLCISHESAEAIISMYKHVQSILGIMMVR